MTNLGDKLLPHICKRRVRNDKESFIRGGLQQWRDLRLRAR